MSARFLLDTNIVSDLVRHPRGVVANRIASVGERAVATSIIVAAELRYGAAKKGSARLTQQLNIVLDALNVLPFEAPADSFYGDVRAAQQRAEQLIGPNDFLIAAQALALDMIVVTANESEFRRVKGLEIENWLR